MARPKRFELLTLRFVVEKSAKKGRASNTAAALKGTFIPALAQGGSSIFPAAKSLGFIANSPLKHRHTPIVLSLEECLPETPKELRSNSPAACVKRLQRSRVLDAQGLARL